MLERETRQPAQLQARAPLPGGWLEPELPALPGSEEQLSC